MMFNDVLPAATSLGYAAAGDRKLTVQPGRAVAFAHATRDAHGWYDVEVTAAGDAAFRRRLMGHIENGRARVSG